MPASPIPDISGPTSNEPWAFYDPDGHCWRTSQGTFPWASDEFSATWPASGMTRNGRAFLLPPLVRRTSGGVSLLWPAPTAARYGTAGGADHPNRRGATYRPSLETMAQHDRWPTPTVNDSRSGRNRTANRLDLDDGHHDGLTLTDAVTLWPTPEASDSTGGRVSKEVGGTRPSGSKRAVTLGTAVAHEQRLWPTPQARDHKDTGANVDWEKVAERSHLAGAVMLGELWPTPRASMANGPSEAEVEAGDPRRRLETSVAAWPTPTARLGAQRGAQAKRYSDPARSNDLDDAVAASGTLGQLNPTWVEWLMGFPIGWTDCEGSATP